MPITIDGHGYRSPYELSPERGEGGIGHINQSSGEGLDAFQLAQAREKLVQQARNDAGSLYTSGGSTKPSVQSSVNLLV